MKSSAPSGPDPVVTGQSHDAPSCDRRLPFYWPIILVLILGFAIRLFAFQYVYIINPDGVLYIHQARAMYYGHWHDLTSCSMSYLSIYPVLISAAYHLFNDWIIAARAVSLFFGSLTLVCLFLFLRRFLERDIATLATLTISLVPVLVDRSADAVRGPVYWFFLVMGLYLFVYQVGGKRYLPYLFMSSFCFLIAAWARIEAGLFIFVSACYIAVVPQEKKLLRLAALAGPILLIFLAAIPLLLKLDLHPENLLRLSEIAAKLHDPLVKYRLVRSELGALARQPTMDTLQFFLLQSRRLVWLIAMGALISSLVKAFFYPFFLIFLTGLGGIRARIKNDPRVLYPVIAAGSSLVLLYFHIMQTWVIEDRFFAIFILPASVFLGFGLEKIRGFLQSRFRLKGSAALLLICLAILALSLPKNLKPREKDKLVFREIGQLISETEGNQRVIPVAASMHTVRWVSFYANLKYRGSPCPQPYSDFAMLVGNSYTHFLRNLKARGIKYFLWAEKQWPAKRFDFISSMRPGDFAQVGRWYHPDTGRMILFRVLQGG